MLNVFVISSDKRVERLIAHFQPFFKTKIRQAADFDQGLKEVFENRPSMVFIQSTIDSVSGETVARHIKSLLGSESPKIIFMDETPGGEKKGASWCDDSLVISDSAQQFQANFATLVARYHPDDWRELRGEKKTEPSFSLADSDDARQIVDDVVTDQAERESATCDASPALREEPHETVPLPLSSAPVSRMDALSPEAEEYPEGLPREVNLPPPAVSLPVKKKTGRYLATLTGVLLLVIAGICLYLYRIGLSDMAASIKQPVPVSVAPEESSTAVSSEQGKKGLVTLPAFIRPEFRDHSFSNERPGWERYLLPDYEIRVFREGGVLRALQVIAQKDAGISDSFLQSTLRELGYSGPVPSGTERKKDGFLVKSAIVTGFAELVTYRKDGAANLQAFVLEFI